MISTGPAPIFDGETVTSSSWITPVSAMRTGARASFSKSSSPQPAKSAAAIASPAHARTLVTTQGNLTEPDRFARQYQVVQLLLDPQPDALGEAPDERDVVGVLGSVGDMSIGSRKRMLNFAGRYISPAASPKCGNAWLIGK